MPTFSLDINGVEAGVAEGRKVWSGPLPPNGIYEGKLQIVSLAKIGQNAKPENRGKDKLNICVELVNTEDGKYDGFQAWTSLNLIEDSVEFLNQWLLAMTDGSDSQFLEIKKAFYETKWILDERKVHVEQFGRWKINSPKGEMPIKVTLKQSSNYNDQTKQTTTSSRIDSFVLGGGGGAAGGASVTSLPTAHVEEESVVVLDDEDETPDTTGDDSSGQAVSAESVFAGDDNEEDVVVTS